ncbi:hypothetical protein VP01_2695g3 [Puccinia sorghi]|uniref:CxC1-like cysteine cluster associated with KDZ transposases domain-containing protein n=1 Tax=Puccinia sorghi TaxID=27349 RepID=A0A0L6V5K4_9BASI|nr:hypothetical protein VP01_2695g3 [Puccinia sorghi]
MGYLASTPKRPETAFSMQLLGFHNHLWQWCHVAFMPFMGMLRCWLEEQSPPLFTACGKKRSLRKQFTQSVDVYQKLLKMSNQLITKSLKLTRQQSLAATVCPSCFGQTHVQSQSIENPLLICLDGNFQHRHHKAASTNFNPLITPDGFIDPSQIQDMKQEIKASKKINSIPKKVRFYLY